jgi:hypothetical protein
MYKQGRRAAAPPPPRPPRRAPITCRDSGIRFGPRSVRRSGRIEGWEGIRDTGSGEREPPTLPVSLS